MTYTLVEATTYKQASPATISDLHTALMQRMAIVADRYWGMSSKSAYPLNTRAPSIVDGWLPPKSGPEVEQFPFIEVRPRSGEDSIEGADQQAVAVFDLIIGTYSDSDTGWHDVMILVDAIRDEVGSRPRLVGNVDGVDIQTAFQHVGPLSWEIPAEQPRPQWFGVVTTRWSLPRPRRTGF